MKYVAMALLALLALVGGCTLTILGRRFILKLLAGWIAWRSDNCRCGEEHIVVGFNDEHVKSFCMVCPNCGRVILSREHRSMIGAIHAWNDGETDMYAEFMKGENNNGGSKNEQG